MSTRNENMAGLLEQVARFLRNSDCPQTVDCFTLQWSGRPLKAWQLLTAARREFGDKVEIGSDWCGEFQVNLRATLTAGDEDTTRARVDMWSCGSAADLGFCTDESGKHIHALTGVEAK